MGKEESGGLGEKTRKGKGDCSRATPLSLGCLPKHPVKRYCVCQARRASEHAEKETVTQNDPAYPHKANDHQTQTPQGNLYLLYRQRGSSSTIFAGFTPNPAAFGKRNPGSWTILRKMRPIHRISTWFSTALWKVVLRNRCFFTTRSFVRHCIFFFLSTCFHRSFPPGCGKPC